MVLEDMLRADPSADPSARGDARGRPIVLSVTPYAARSTPRRPRVPAVARTVGITAVLAAVTIGAAYVVGTALDLDAPPGAPAALWFPTPPTGAGLDGASLPRVGAPIVPVDPAAPPTGGPPAPAPARGAPTAAAAVQDDRGGDARRARDGGDDGDRSGRSDRSGQARGEDRSGGDDGGDDGGGRGRGSDDGGGSGGGGSSGSDDAGGSGGSGRSGGSDD